MKNNNNIVKRLTARHLRERSYLFQSLFGTSHSVSVRP